jgi:DNA-binding GntR family transcriptional regulator
LALDCRQSILKKGYAVNIDRNFRFCFKLPPMSQAPLLSPLAAPPEGQTLADHAYNMIADAIVRGDLALGARISESALSKRFGIGRGPLREALRRLEGRKLVAVKPHSGARVVSLTIRDIVELYEIREVLEALACRLATERMTEAELDRLDALLAVHERDPLQGRGHSRAAPNPDFHMAVTMGSKNRQLIELLGGELFDLMRVYRYRSSGLPGRTPRAFIEHRDIAAAIRRRDAEQAATLMRKHVRQSRLNLLRQEGITDLLSSEAAG